MGDAQGPGAVGDVAALVRPVRGRLLAAVALQVVSSGLSVIPLIALARLATQLPDRDPSAWSSLAWFLTALGFQALTGMLALLISHLADADLQANLRLRLADVLARVPLGWFDDRSTGRVRRIVQDDVESLHQLVAHSLVELVAAVLTPTAAVVLVLVVDWRLGLLCLVPMLAYVLVFSILSPGDMRGVMARIDELLAHVASAIVELVDGIAVLRVFGRAQSGAARFEKASRDFRTEFVALVTPQMRAQSWALVAITLPVVALTVLVPGTAMVDAGWTTSARVVLATLVALSLPSTLLTLALARQSLATAREAAARVVALLDEPVLPVPDHGQAPRDSSIGVDHVTFGYEPGAAVLHDITLCLPAGTTTALVGPSGSGKSTLATLVARFRDVDAGSITLGGVDVRDIDEATLRAHVTVLLQDVQLPAVSVRDAIALGRPHASDDEVAAAARAAAIHERILALPRGYDSIIGRDARLSGGEAQRVAIARAFLADAPVVILDEPTSATDPETERDVQASLQRLAAGRTVIVIAHRLSTVVHADQIVVLERGRVREVGTHAQLVAADGAYAALWADQDVAAL